MQSVGSPNKTRYGTEQSENDVGTLGQMETPLLDWHSMFTGRCPECEITIKFRERSLWKCDHCGWWDDSPNKIS
ncbi:hypothetical protein IQ250_02810 [Pseudanabaenaceae cyanobacterium LEGE 13415]|nr:hypothetical protein [Pseudanabaenaceae cyanobacterium LEGE 13415]